MSQYKDDAVKKVQEAWEEGVRDPSVNIFCGRGKSFFSIGEGIDINCTHVVLAPANYRVNVVQKLGRSVRQNREERLE